MTSPEVLRTATERKNVRSLQVPFSFHQEFSASSAAIVQAYCYPETVQVSPNLPGLYITREPGDGRAQTRKIALDGGLICPMAWLMYKLNAFRT